MKSEATSGKEASESVDEQRAEWEGANFAMTVCANGVVNVANQNYNESGHVYSVRVEDGHAVGCSCPHAVHRDAHCKHQRAVETRPLVVSSASAAGASYAPGRRVATDGGHPAGTSVEAGESPETAGTPENDSESGPGDDDATAVTVEDYRDLGEVYEQTGDRPADCRCDEQLGDYPPCLECARRDFATPNPEVGGTTLDGCLGSDGQ